MPRLWRVHHPHADGALPSPLLLDPGEANHVCRVLRLRVGDPLAVFDGAGNEWIGTLVSCDAVAVAVRLEERLTDRVEAPLPVSLFQGACRPDRMDWVVQKGTELGLVAVYCLGDERANARRLERWRRIALESCKQSGRRVLPRVEVRPSLPAVPGPGTLALALDTAAGCSPLAARTQGAPPDELWLAVGPEGGFTDAERGLWGASGWQPASLGPRILRTETAGLVAASVLLHVWGDLGR